VTFRANTGILYTYDPADMHSVNTSLGVEAYSSPSIAGEPSGTGYEVAFQAKTTDELYIHDTSTNSNVITGRVIEAATDPYVAAVSPSIAVSSSGSYEVAYPGANGDLWIYKSATGTATDANLGMQLNTSPSIAISSSGAYEVAFQANTGILYTYDVATGVSVKTNLGVGGTTSPAAAN
jgi:hypothetical protein